MRIIACSSSNRNSASARASSVLPTPVGPRKMKQPIGRLGSLSPPRARMHGLGDGFHRFVLADDALVQILLPDAAAFAFRLRAACETGMPVQRLTTSAMSSSSTSSLSSALALLSSASFCSTVQLPLRVR